MKLITPDLVRASFSGTNGIARRTLSIEGFARAGVLIPLLPVGNSFDLLFTKRTETVETHKGQISFPGGMVDTADTDIVQTALREAQEEIGLTRSNIEIIGELDDMATPTGFVITPVVGIVTTLPMLTPNYDEVAEVFQVGLDFFVEPTNGRTEMRTFRGQTYEVWYYNFTDRVIWGATAMMVRSLLSRLGLV